MDDNDLEGRRFHSNLRQGILLWLEPNELKILIETYFPEILNGIHWQTDYSSVVQDAITGIANRGLFEERETERDGKRETRIGLFTILAAACPTYEKEIRLLAESVGIHIPNSLPWIRLIPSPNRGRRIFLSYSRKDEHRAKFIQTDRKSVV